MCHLSTRLHGLETQGEAVLSPGHSGNQRGDQVAEAGPGMGDTGRSLALLAQMGRGCSRVINLISLEIGPPGGKSEAATCN